jgi:hypothetical protein
MFYVKAVNVYFPHSKSPLENLSKVVKDKAYFMHGSNLIAAELFGVEIPEEIANIEGLRRVLREEISDKIMYTVSDELNNAANEIDALKRLSVDGIFSPRLIYQRVIDGRTVKYRIPDDKDFKRNINPIKRAHNFRMNIERQGLKTLDEITKPIYDAAGTIIMDNGIPKLENINLGIALKDTYTIYLGIHQKLEKI